MASLGKTFDATTVEPREAMEALPLGDYHGQIVASEWKDVAAPKTGRYLEFQLDVLSGPMAGRKAWDRLNLDNPSQQAVEMAERTLSAICHATGVMNVTDTDQLHFKPLIFKMGPRKDQPQQTEVKGYKRFEGVTPAVAPAAAGKTSAPPAARVTPSYAAPAPKTPAHGTQAAPAPSYGAQQPAPPPPAPNGHAPGPWAR